MAWHLLHYLDTFQVLLLRKKKEVESKEENRTSVTESHTVRRGGVRLVQGWLGIQDIQNGAMLISRRLSTVPCKSVTGV